MSFFAQQPLDAEGHDENGNCVSGNTEQNQQPSRNVGADDPSEVPQGFGRLCGTEKEDRVP
jgi:hypothetical protein